MTTSSTAGTRPAPAGRALLDLIATDPSAPMSLAIAAPGGYGKTTLLRGLERAYRAAGVAVIAAWHPAPDRPTGEEVLLVDDAHLLDEARLGELRDLADGRARRLAVAYRPWPRPVGLVELIDVLRRSRPPLVLPPLDADQVRLSLTAAMGGPPTPAMVDFVLTQTRGVPRYVARLADALASPSTVRTGEVAADRAGGAQARLPAAAVVPFAADLDELDRDLRLFLLAVEAGVGLHFDLIGALLGLGGGAVAELMEAARATGLLGPDGTLVPMARHAIAVLGPIAHRVHVRQRLAALQLDRGGAVLPLVRPLLNVGVGAGTGPAFEAAGQEALGEDPALAARLFAAAVGAGRPAAGRQALATALAGDLDSASRLADRVITAGDPAERHTGAYVSAVALAHRGQLARSVELFRWAQPGPATGFAVVGLVGTGRLAEARRLADEPVTGAGDASGRPPTLVGGAASLMARGLCESVVGSPATALSVLVQATTLLEPAGTAVLLPDSPAALAAVLALHCAELDIADVLLERAIGGRIGGPPLVARHHLLQAWLLMVRGRTAAAQDRLAATTAARAGEDARYAVAPARADDGAPYAATVRDGATEPADHGRLHGRDLLFAAALRLGLARRNSDLTALREAWPAACEALVGHPVDLFTLLPLGELTVAAARLGEQRWLAGHLAEADFLLRELGDPPLWGAHLRWSRLHAAIIAEQPTEAEGHAAALAANRSHSPYAAALAAAAQSWLAVLAGRIEPDEVEAAARGLATLGLRWDGARLAGQAAIRTADRTAMTALLDCARLLLGRPPDHRLAPTATSPAGRGRTTGRRGTGGRGGDGATAGDDRSLSDRERQVADLVLAGLTYKQIGDRLYISAKTVEHHMARIRHRLGCSDRRDLLARLRAMTVEQTAPNSRTGAEGVV